MPAPFRAVLSVHEVNAVLATSTRPRSRSRKLDSGRVPRPRNAFILFRSYWYIVRPPRIPDPESNEQNRLSVEAGAVWRSMDARQRAAFIAIAKDEKAEHNRLYPDYVYCPGRVSGASGKAKSIAKATRARRASNTASKPPSTTTTTRRRRASTRASRRVCHSDDEDTDEDMSPPRTVAAPRIPMSRAAAQRAISAFTKYSDSEASSSASSSPASSAIDSPRMRTNRRTRRGAISFPSPASSATSYVTSVSSASSPDSDMSLDDHVAGTPSGAFVPTSEIPALELSPFIGEDADYPNFLTDLTYPQDPATDFQALQPHMQLTPHSGNPALSWGIHSSSAPQHPSPFTSWSAEANGRSRLSFSDAAQATYGSDTMSTLVLREGYNPLRVVPSEARENAGGRSLHSSSSGVVSLPSSAPAPLELESTSLSEFSLNPMAGISFGPIETSSHTYSIFDRIDVDHCESEWLNDYPVSGSGA